MEIFWGRLPNPKWSSYLSPELGWILVWNQRVSFKFKINEINVKQKNRKTNKHTYSKKGAWFFFKLIQMLHTREQNMNLWPCSN